MQKDIKRRIVVSFQNYLLNPPIKAIVALGLAPGYALIETRGRRSGEPRRTVVGVHEQDGVVWIVAEQGRHAGYVRNLQADPQVRLRLRGEWRRGVARVVEEDDPYERLEEFSRVHAAMVRRFGTELLSIRVELAGD